MIELALGVHAVGESQVNNNFLDAIFQGDTQKHEWDGHIRNRVKSLCPSLVALDGLMPFTGNTDEERYSQNLSIWASMPVSPNVIGEGTSPVHVLVGDYRDLQPTSSRVIMDKRIRLAANLALAYGISRPIDSKAASNFIGKVSEWYKHYDNKTGKYVYYDVEFDKLFAPKASPTRRQFLKGLSLFTFLAAASPTYANFIDTDPTRTSALIGDRALSPITEITDKILDVSPWIVGRTAMLIEKTIYYQNAYSDLLPNQKGLVVMGIDHVHKSESLMHSQDSRLEAIGDIYKWYKGKLNDLYADDETVNLPQLQTDLRVMLQRADMYKVSQPDSVTFKTNLERAINDAVKLVSSTNVPSITETLAAL